MISKIEPIILTEVPSAICPLDGVNEVIVGISPTTSANVVILIRIEP